MQRRTVFLGGVVAASALGAPVAATKSTHPSNLRTWRFTPAVDSKWAGVVQIKWCSATGRAFHSTGGPPNESNWYEVLSNINWISIGATGGIASTADIPDRFVVLPHIVFGSEKVDEYTKENHGVFMIDTRAGTTYVLAKWHNSKLCYPFHDDFADCLWHIISEPEGAPERNLGSTGQFQLSAVNSELKVLSHGRLGPYVTRLDTATGQVDIAIPKGQFPDVNKDQVNDVDFVWHTTLPRA